MKKYLVDEKHPLTRWELMKNAKFIEKIIKIKVTNEYFRIQK